jgi:transglutaminase-like putative cysteine protease
VPEINIITVIIIVLFIIPLISGVFKDFTRERIQVSFVSLLDGIEFLTGVLLSIYITRRIFFDSGNSVFNSIYNMIPESIRTELNGNDMLTYMLAVPVLTLLMLFVLRAFTNIIFRYVILPLSLRMYNLLDSSGRLFKAFAGILWEVPRGICYVVVFSLAVNFLSYYVDNPNLSGVANDSFAYRFIYKNALYPILNSNTAKQIPVLLNDSFSEAMDRVLPGADGSIGDKLQKQLGKSNIKIIEYFNGVTLDEAVVSDARIDETAGKIAGKEKDDKKKAYLIYRWISRNVKYDYDKAANIVSNPEKFSSGSIIAYNTRKGICFDYSCLYISMCRAVGLKVRLITGLGYSGVSWGDHAWNQVYYPAENRWINVDTTFGTNLDYFDRSDFHSDHKYDEIQGEW